MGSIVPWLHCLKFFKKNKIRDWNFFEIWYNSNVFGGLAQLVRVPASHAGGRRFEPASPHQNRQLSPYSCRFIFLFFAESARSPPSFVKKINFFKKSLDKPPARWYIVNNKKNLRLRRVAFPSIFRERLMVEIPWCNVKWMDLWGRHESQQASSGRREPYPLSIRLT